MAARTPVLTEFGNPILTRRARRVSRAFRESPACAKLVSDMARTLGRAKGVGLAAPQIGVPLRIAIIEAKKTPERPDARAIPRLVVLNPRILAYHGNPVRKWEGCLSLHKVFGRVPRYSSVTVEYEDLHGSRTTRRVSGLFAHIFQHEVDHLDGIRFIDRMEDAKTLMSAAEYRKMKAKKAPR